MDAQDLVNGFGGGFIEGESDIIGEEEDGDEHNNSMDNIRQSKKHKPKSLDGFEEQEETSEADKEDFFRNLSEIKKPSFKQHRSENKTPTLPISTSAAKYRVTTAFNEAEEEEHSDDSDEVIKRKQNPHEDVEAEESTKEMKNKKKLEIQTSFGSESKIERNS